jgi:hypothetical protein
MCSELSSGMYCRVKLLSTDVSEYIPEDNSEFINGFTVSSTALGVHNGQHTTKQSS